MNKQHVRFSWMHVNDATVVYRVRGREESAGVADIIDGIAFLA